MGNTGKNQDLKDLASDVGMAFGSILPWLNERGPITEANASRIAEEIVEKFIVPAREKGASIYIGMFLFSFAKALNAYHAERPPDVK